MEVLFIVAVWYALVYPGLKSIGSSIHWKPIEGERYFAEKHRLFLYIAPFLLLAIQWIVALEWLDVQTTFEETLDFFLLMAQITGVIIFTILAYQTAQMKGWKKFIQYGSALLGFSFGATVTYEVHPMHLFANEGGKSYLAGYVYFGGMALITLVFIAYGYYRHFRETKMQTVQRAQAYSLALIGVVLILSVAYKSVHESGQFLIAALLFFISWYGMSFLLSSLSKGWRRAFAFQFSVTLVYLFTELYVIDNFALWWNIG